ARSAVPADEVQADRVQVRPVGGECLEHALLGGAGIPASIPDRLGRRVTDQDIAPRAGHRSVRGLPGYDRSASSRVNGEDQDQAPRADNPTTHNNNVHIYIFNLSE